MAALDPSPTGRFSDRVENYRRYRPGYPGALIRFLLRELKLQPGTILADAGSGTGLSAAPFLEAGLTVYGIEPNRQMREAAETWLAGYPGFKSVNGTAEATGLADRSVDHILAGQAFHWFEPKQTACEFRRILKPGGSLVLMWNTRQTGTTGFAEAYEALLRKHGTDYEAVGHRGFSRARVERVFPGVHFGERNFPNRQELDWAGLKGRLFSSSYVPGENDPGSAPMLEELARIFERFDRSGRVVFDYTTELYWGRIGLDPGT